MESLEYQAPSSLGEFMALVENNSHAQVLAGGTDLIIQMRSGLKTPRTIIDIKKIPELTGIVLTDDELRLGAATPCAQIVERQDVAQVFPGLIEAIGLIGSTQIQNRSTVGGNLCNASPAADSVPALIVNRAQCIIASPQGQRTVAVENFNTGPGENSLAENELLLALTVPRAAPHTSDAYLRFIPRSEMDIAVVGAAVSITLDKKGVCSQARVAIGAVAPTALLVAAAAEALVGSTLDGDAIDKAVQAVREAARPISDMRGTAEFRRHVVGVMTKRAALIAKKRILG